MPAPVDPSAEIPAFTNNWKDVRDAMVAHLRTTLKPDTTPEVMKLMAKFEMKLKALETEADFEKLNRLAEESTIKALELPEVKKFILTEMTK